MKLDQLQSLSARRNAQLIIPSRSAIAAGGSHGRDSAERPISRIPLGAQQGSAALLDFVFAGRSTITEAKFDWSLAVSDHAFIHSQALLLIEWRRWKPSTWKPASPGAARLCPAAAAPKQLSPGEEWQSIVNIVNDIQRETQKRRRRPHRGRRSHLRFVS